MSDEFKNVVVSAVKNWEQGLGLMEKLFAVAQPGAVYSEPVTVGEHTIITASEVKVGMGFGCGMGAGTEDESAEGEPQGQGGKAGSSGVGGGGGGGGVSGGRPVAVISIGPDGVRVEPVVDPTTIALAFFTTIGSMFIMLGKMRKAGASRRKLPRH